MRAFKSVHKRNRALVVVLLPVLVLLTFVGWILYSLNLKPKKQTHILKTHSQNRTDGVTFIPAIFDEQNEQIRK